MNNDRRKTLAAVVAILDELEPMLHEAATDTESVKDEEQDALDSVSEHFPGSEREAMGQEAVDALTEATDALQGMLDALDEAKSALDTASQ